MLKAIITQIKTGTITNVIPRGQNVVNPEKPYVVVWGPEPIAQAGLDKAGKNLYRVNVHYPKGYIDDIDDYIFNELPTLLTDGIKLTTRDGRTVQLFHTMEIGDIVESNDDNTLSKDRVFESVAMY